jgi:aspartate kinase
VVSAMKGVTDLLIRALDEHNPAFIDEAVSMYVDEALYLELKSYAKFLEFVNEELRRFVNIDEPWVKDHTIVHGELLSSLLVEGILNDIIGVRAKAVYEPGIVVKQEWGNASVIHELSNTFVRERYDGLIRKYDVVVVPGFLGVTLDGRYASLGRGGSDYTASLLANYLSASGLTFYTDSGGLLSGDPKVVNDPVLIREVCYEEAYAAAMVGAKKFHPRTFEPLLNSNVRMLITSPWLDVGTYITNKCIDTPKIVSLSGDGRSLKVSVVGYNAAKREDVFSEVYTIASSYGINSITHDNDHVLSMPVDDYKIALTLVRDIHRWVRKWIS